MLGLSPIYSAADINAATIIVRSIEYAKRDRALSSAKEDWAKQLNTAKGVVALVKSQLAASKSRSNGGYITQKKVARRLLPFRTKATLFLDPLREEAEANGTPMKITAKELWSELGKESHALNPRPTLDQVARFLTGYWKDPNDELFAGIRQRQKIEEFEEFQRETKKMPPG